MAKKILIALPEILLRRIDNLAAMEGRNRSDTMREMLRDALPSWEARNRAANALTTTIPAPAPFHGVDTNV